MLVQGELLVSGGCRGLSGRGWVAGLVGGWVVRCSRGTFLARRPTAGRSRCLALTWGSLTCLALPMRPDATARLQAKPPPPGCHHHHQSLLTGAACTFLGPAAIHEPVHARNITPSPRRLSTSSIRIRPPPPPPPPSPTPSNTLSMAANGQQVFDPVLAAHNTMASAADRAQKEQAHQFLEQFQKSVRGCASPPGHMRLT